MVVLAVELHQRGTEAVAHLDHDAVAAAHAGRETKLRPRRRIKAEFVLAAQGAQHVIKKVCDAYRTLHANLAAGNLGKPGSAQRIKAEGKPIRRGESDLVCRDGMWFLHAAVSCAACRTHRPSGC